LGYSKYTGSVSYYSYMKDLLPMIDYTHKTRIMQILEDFSCKEGIYVSSIAQSLGWLSKVIINWKKKEFSYMYSNYSFNE